MDSWVRRGRKTASGSIGLTDDNLTFQTLTWRGYDVDCFGEDKYVVTTCGCNKKGQSIGLTITGFNPFLYVKIPDRIRIWTGQHKSDFETLICRMIGEAAVVGIERVDRKIIYPFTNQKNFKFVKITCASLKAFRKLSWSFKKKISGTTTLNFKWELYESNLDPLVRFTHCANITTAGWVNVCKTSVNNNFTRCEINLSTKAINNITQCTNISELGIAPFVLASYDIEVDSIATRNMNKTTYKPSDSLEKRKKLPTVFPNALKGDTIRIICTSFQRFGTDQYFKHCIALSPCASVEGADCLQVVDTETDLIIAWLQLIKTTDPDVVMGYNIYGFDDKYIHDRLEKLQLNNYLDDLSRVKYIDCQMKDSKLVTSAYGTNFFKILDIPCMFKVDLYVWFKKETKLESYKLDKVAEKYLGDNKIDLPVIDLFFKMNSTDTDMAECCKYCIQDTMLPLRLTEARKIFINLIGMANITRVPIEWLITRGQQIKVFSQLSFEARLNDVLIPTWEIPDDAPDEKFLGATVLHAKKGAYFEGVSGLDFKSLYPSIMIAYNLCYSSMILDEDLELYKNTDGLEIETISWEQDGVEQTYNYVQNIPGIVPNVLDKLWKQRNDVKRKMKQANKDGHTTLAGILDAEQLAIKVSMNSVYGFTGATKGYLPKKPIASSVTAMGRNLIKRTKEFCETTYDCDVVYGDTDSCYVKFDVGLDNKHPDYMQKIFDISQKATTECNERLYKMPIELEFEKVMMPFLLFTKKRYAYVEYEPPDIRPKKLDAKGIHLVRRDNCEYVRTVSKKILDIMFFELDVDKAKDYALDCIGNLLENKCTVKELQLSKTLKVGYKCSKCHTVETECKCKEGPRVNLPHVQLAKRLKEASASDIPQPGERVPFVFVKGVGLQHERVAHPEYMQDQRPDGLYYLEHQLRNPLQTLFELVLPNNDTSVLFENGPYGSKIKRLKDEQKVRETQYKGNKRLEKAQGFREGQAIIKRVGTQPLRSGTVLKIEGDRITVKFEDSTKSSTIYPDSIEKL